MKKIIIVFLLMFSFVGIVNADNNYIVNNKEEALEIMRKIYDDSMPYDDYFLVAANETVDMNSIFESIKEEYVSPIGKRIYKYEEYGVIHREKFYGSLNDNIIAVNNRNKVITEKENNEATEFAKLFIDKYKNLDDYNKIYAIYSYLSHTVKYPEENAYFNYVEAPISIYDTLINKTGDCIGMSIAFQYLAEQMGIESYIVDRVVSINEELKEYISVHSYNIVKLDNKWYIVDVHNNDDMSGLLIGRKDAYLNDNYNDIDISIDDYIRPKENVTVEYNLTYKKTTSSITWIVFGLFIMLITLIVLFFTKK